MNTDTIAFILAGGKKPSLDILSRKRAKAAIPFGGHYRIIDFVLSNLMNSGISRVGVLTQYRPESLMDHINDGEAWDLDGRRRGIKILPPYQRQCDSDWYKGTADAVFQNLNFIADYSPSHVLMVSGDHIYRMDYRDILHWHHEKNADITIVTKHVVDAPPRMYGMLDVAEDLRITAYDEKPEHVRFHDISLGIYLFDADILVPLLQMDSHLETSTHDIGRDIIGPIVGERRVFAYPYDETWLYLGTVRDYWHANMELLKDKPMVRLKDWAIQTNLYEANVANLPPTRFRGKGFAENSLIANGCQIEGSVSNSVLFPGVTVSKDSIVDNCILMHDVHVGPGSHLREVIADKKVHFDGGNQIGFGEDTPNEHFPHFFNTGLTVFAKGVRIAAHAVIGRNVLVFSDIMSETKVPSGAVTGDAQ